MEGRHGVVSAVISLPWPQRRTLEMPWTVMVPVEKTPEPLWTLHTTPMACNSLCRPCGPTPLANSCNEPCALQCQDSHVVINPSPVLVTLPGPIMTSFPQNTAVGSTSSAAVGTELSVQGQPISGGFGGFGGFGYGLGYGRGFGYGLGGLGCYGRRGGYIC
ncbi:feather beta keratin-like isoform X1 [Cyanistes caeruleus]|nr:feather beta keratin-like isoform X1 [Cyanistes caeruleus]XP_023801038.1 feather beta keratin-like isoform X1 [Cyanistes caeruleus]XP_023801039.1 feather beta keratin-like isoform X1 [Cyanistes caeruleus]XP_023801040.1 feather beta keratin-like isoform X1 [Cyanistes caeruleus]XP_023801042.1 feather beta keratin-like isoform X1 [Cyanistes caeruleus]